MANEEAARCTFRHEELPENYQCPHPAEFDGRQVCVFHWNPQDEDEKKRKATFSTSASPLSSRNSK